MSTRTLLLTVAFALAPLTAAADRPATSYTPKLTEAEARAAALREVPGTVLEIELDREKGVWVYEVEIRPDADPKGEAEVTLDADTGALIDVELDD